VQSRIARAKIHLFQLLTQKPTIDPTKAHEYERSQREVVSLSRTN
jgi:hypothetical protein